MNKVIFFYSFPSQFPPQTQRTQDVEPMSIYFWPTVYEAGPTLNQHRLKVFCSLHRKGNPANTKRWINVDLLSAHRLRRWTNIKSTLVPSIVFAGKLIHVFWSYEIPKYIIYSSMFKWELRTCLSWGIIPGLSQYIVFKICYVVHECDECDECDEGA